MLNIGILRSEWMLTESFVPVCANAACNYFSGRLVDLLPKLALPAVPGNVALIPINGVMTKADVCESIGTRSLTTMVSQADGKYKIFIHHFIF